MDDKQEKKRTHANSLQKIAQVWFALGKGICLKLKKV
jgi:hypothetical protein